MQCTGGGGGEGAFSSGGSHCHLVTNDCWGHWCLGTNDWGVIHDYDTRYGFVPVVQVEAKRLGGDYVQPVTYMTDGRGESKGL